MNPMLIFVALAVGAMLWVLVVSLRAGEFRYGSRGHDASHVKKSESPGVFWGLVVIHAGIILYVLSLAFQL